VVEVKLGKESLCGYCNAPGRIMAFDLLPVNFPEGRAFTAIVVYPVCPDHQNQFLDDLKGLSPLRHRT
jgi:hypothetical protein